MAKDDYTAHDLSAIRKSADVVKDAAVQWARASRALNSAYIGSGAFGKVGDENNIPQAYAGIVGGAIETLDEGVDKLQAAASALYRIAKAYEENEDNISYEIWLARGLSPESWHIHGRRKDD